MHYEDRHCEVHKLVFDFDTRVTSKYVQKRLMRIEEGVGCLLTTLLSFRRLLPEPSVENDD